MGELVAHHIHTKIPHLQPNVHLWTLTANFDWVLSANHNVQLVHLAY